MKEANGTKRTAETQGAKKPRNWGRRGHVTLFVKRFPRLLREEVKVYCLMTHLTMAEALTRILDRGLEICRKQLKREREARAKKRKEWDRYSVGFLVE